MQQFEITLKNDKARQYDRLAFFLILINVFVFIFLGFYSGSKQSRIISLLGSSIVLIMMVLDHFLYSIKLQKESPYKLAAEFFIFATWLLLHNWWLAVIILMLGLLYKISQRSLAVIITGEKIVYPSFPQKQLKWAELNNVMLKDGMLTIDCKNNKLIQQFIDEKKSAVNELEFNDFCRAQLIK